MNIPFASHRQRRFTALATAFVAVAALSACSSTPPPTAELAASSAAVTQAAGAGAGTFAPAEILSARNKLDRAKVAVAAEDMVLARRLADQSLADAQWAQAKAEAAKARAAADELKESTRVLREELGRKAPQ